MSDTKPMHLYGHPGGPNPWKVVMILEELSIPYEMEMLDLVTVKQEPYITINPNGRVPAITDPNTGITLFESGAIIDYLIDTYDKDHKISHAESPQKHQERSWEHFQMSGQGPYFGQLYWFKKHDEQIPSAIERYSNEAKRVLSVIELHLNKTGNEYLVGNTASYADIMFVSWNYFVPMLLEDFDWKATYPKCYEWNQKLLSRPVVKKALEDKAKVAGH